MQMNQSPSDTAAFHASHVTCRNAILQTPVGCAASNGHDRVIQLLTSARADVNPKDKSKATPLHLASKEGHLAAVKILLKHHADVSDKDEKGYNALDWAIENGHR